MLIVEGADCVGKTTLCRSLWSHPRIQALGMEIQHLSRLPEGHNRCSHYIKRMNINGIFDRFVLSEIAYQRMRGDAQLLTMDKRMLVECALKLHCSFTVLIVAERPQVIDGNWNKDEMYSKEQVHTVNRHFSNLTTSTLVDLVISRYEADDYPNVDLIENIVSQYVTKRERFRDIYGSTT